VYPSAVVPGAWGWLYGLNPMTGVIEGFRWALLGQGDVPAQFGVSVVAIAGVLVGGLLYFSRIEGTIGDRV
jgi:lipopolysaccharide transport system permease protein